MARLPGGKAGQHQVRGPLLTLTAAADDHLAGSGPKSPPHARGGHMAGHAPCGKETWRRKLQAPSWHWQLRREGSNRPVATTACSSRPAAIRPLAGAEAHLIPGLATFTASAGAISFQPSNPLAGTNRSCRHGSSKPPCGTQCRAGDWPRELAGPRGRRQNRRCCAHR